MKRNHNQLSRRGRRLARTALVVGLGVGATGGAIGMHSADKSAQASAARQAQPWCEVPANNHGIDYSIAAMGADPYNSEVKVIESNGNVVNPFSEASMVFGNRIPADAIVAVNHIGEAACAAADGVSSQELTPDLQDPIQLNRAANK